MECGRRLQQLLPGQPHPETVGRPELVSKQYYVSLFTIFRREARDVEIYKQHLSGKITAYNMFCDNLISSPTGDYLIMGTVCINTLLLCTDGLVSDSVTFLTDMNLICSGIFWVECYLKVQGRGLIG